jgi:predicted RNA polymerase sigma factor
VADYHLLHSARGRFLVQLERCKEAREAYLTALHHTTLEPERRFILSRIAALDCQGEVLGTSPTG